MMDDLCLQICRIVIGVQLTVVYQLYLVCQQYEIEGLSVEFSSGMMRSGHQTTSALLAAFRQ